MDTQDRTPCRTALHSAEQHPTQAQQWLRQWEGKGVDRVWSVVGGVGLGWGQGSCFPLCTSPFAVWCGVGITLCPHLWIPGDTTILSEDTTILYEDTTGPTQSMSAVQSNTRPTRTALAISTCIGNALHCTGKLLDALAMPSVVLAMSHRGPSLVRHPLDIQASFPPWGWCGVVC